MNIIANDDLTYLRSKCHPTEPTWAVMNRSLGVIEIQCAKCGSVLFVFHNVETFPEGATC